MANVDDFVRYTNTTARRRTFYCYCTQEFVQDQGVFFVLVEAFRVGRKKRQAEFLNNWFINGNIPENLQEGGYLTLVNISADLKNTTSTGVTGAIAAIGKTFSDKQARAGGGVGGFFSALGTALFKDTKVPANLFDAAQRQVAGMLNDRHGFGGDGGGGATYRPDGTYQPRGTYAAQAQIFKLALTENGFDPDDLGIY
jgi:hypothetical protein